MYSSTIINDDIFVNKGEVDCQKVDAAEVLNSIAQLTPAPPVILPTATMEPPASATTASARSLILPIKLTAPSSKPYTSSIPSHFSLPPPLTALKPNINNAEHIIPAQPEPVGVYYKDAEKGKQDPILTIPSLSMAHQSSTNSATIEISDNQLPVLRVPPALPTITVSLPSSSSSSSSPLPSSQQLVKQEMSLAEKASFIASNSNASLISLPSVPLPQVTVTNKSASASSRPTTLNIPKPLIVPIPTILMQKEPTLSASSSLLSLANVSAIQNHLPVLPPPTRHNISAGRSSINNSTNTNNNIANSVPSNTTTALNKNETNSSLMIGESSGPPTLTHISIPTMIKQELGDVVAVPPPPLQASTLSVSKITSKSNGNHPNKINKRKLAGIGGKPNKAADVKSGSLDNNKIKNNNVSNIKLEEGPSQEEEEEEDEEMCNYLDLSNLSNEDKRKVLRRQRNKEAAARCRKRRLDQTLSLQEQVDDWLVKRNDLQHEIAELQNQETDLQNILSVHQLTTNCKIKDRRSSNNKNNSIVMTKLEPLTSGGLGSLAAVAAAVSNSMQMAKKINEEVSSGSSTVSTTTGNTTTKKSSGKASTVRKLNL